MHSNGARAWHTLTAVVAVAALLLQLALVISGSATLVDEDPPGLAARLGRLGSYFTIQSNVLVALTSLQLARDPHRDGRWWRALRLDAVVAITVTGLVHWFLLRPILDLDGADRVADVLLHVVVPVLAVVAWAVHGPRPRVDAATIARALVWPVAWLGYILVVGALSGWYPYPFLDVGQRGYGPVLATVAGVVVLFLALCAGARLLDRAAPAAPRGASKPGQRVRTRL